MKKVWLGDLLPVVADYAGANSDEVVPVASALIDVLSSTLAEGTSVGIVGLGSFNIDGKTVVFSPSRRVLNRLQAK